MRLLILGGTRFVGRHIADAALARGWHVTLFNRGRQDPSAFPEAEHIRGDRDGDLAGLAEGQWDAVIDTCGYVPRIVRASAELLADRVGLYVFISTCSVYADSSSLGSGEDAPLGALQDPGSEDVDSFYGELKAACERVVGDVFHDRAAVIRPGLIVGPEDPTNRFTYWVRRIAAGGEVLAPEPRDQPTQVIDARDLAAWALELVAAGTGGTFNAVGDIQTMDQLLDTVVRATGADARLRWVAEARLLAAGLEPWVDVPLWLAPDSNPSERGFLAHSNARAKAAGLSLRPLEDTVRDTLAWARTAPLQAGGLDPEIERRLLAGG
jgi:2'-hydroxyisoflavone reductase